MAKLVFALNQSLDGYVDHTAFPPDPCFFVISSTTCAAWPAACTVAACMR